ncbi:4-diphosphocytidyl-2-C-methyl-D-erythritol kinase [gut metagenome]|uniref:4-diphosphocytidyl-2-C-methyl-D-erythritol kinase n=1 Tax=gut metagenome TaxID=749906 RepID=J9FQN5_9ZZZZ
MQGVKGISTAKAFANFDEREPRELDIDIVKDAVCKHDIGLLYQTMVNAFEPQAFEELVELQELKEAMQDAGLVRVVMTGSGSCLMGFSVDDEVLDEAYDQLSQHYPFVFKGVIG